MRLPHITSAIGYEMTENLEMTAFKLLRMIVTAVMLQTLGRNQNNSGYLYLCNGRTRVILILILDHELT